MSDPNIAEQLVKALQRPDGDLALRPVHTIGIGAKGYFVPTKAASECCIAEHFANPRVPTVVTVRFSNGSGSATQHDGWSDVRGMATRFHLDKGDYDLIAMTLPEFFAPDPESFLAFCKWAFPKPFSNETPWQKISDFLHLELPKRDAYRGETIRPDEGAIKFADTYAFSQLSVMQAAGIGAPVSYARAAYHAVHTFIITAPDGARRWVRFSWQPAVGVLNTDPDEPPVDVYLQQELRHRIRPEEPVRFTLMMMIGEIGDNFDDPTRPWPPHRRRTVMGTLTLHEIMPQEECERLNFNPCRLTNGIEVSNDPILKVRREAYEYSGRLRHADVCPFAWSDDHGE